MAAKDEYKKQAAEAAAELIESGMVLGLGHGSTLQFALEALAAKLKSGRLMDIIAVPCSKKTEAEMQRLEIPLGDLNSYAKIDLTIDGADEMDPQFNLIKGGGGALLREKIVAQSSRRNVIIVDQSKMSPILGSLHALPLEVAAFGWKRQRDFAIELGGKPTLRVDGQNNPVLSDQGNYLLDCDFGPIPDASALARKLKSRSGILEHGLFIGLATEVIVSGPGGLRHLKAKP